MLPRIDSIGALAVQPELLAAGANAPRMDATASIPGGFANLIQNGIEDLNSNVGAAESSMRDLAAGKTGELHDLMINLERARISVQTFVQVRNKLIESYQELMRMQL